MPEEKRPLKVFLCHAHVDKDAAKALHDRLVQDGVDAWLDKEKLFAGANWEFEIRKAVRECDIFVVCVSEQFTQRFRRKNFAQTEVGIALNEAELKPKDQIYIIPVRLENCAVPKSLQRWHWVDLFEPDGYQRLIRSLNKRVEELEEFESDKGQAGQGNISVVVSGDVSGNLIIGNDNAISSTQADPLRKNQPKSVLHKNTSSGPIDHAKIKQASELVRRFKNLFDTPLVLFHKTDPKKNTKEIKPEHQITIIVAIISAIATLFAALIGILPQLFPPAPVPTVISTPTMTATITLPPTHTTTVTNIPSKTITPSLTLTRTPTPTPSKTKTLTPQPTMYFQSSTGISGKSPFTANLQIANIPNECSEQECDILWEVYGYSWALRHYYSSGWANLEVRKNFNYVFTKHPWGAYEQQNFVVTATIRFSNTKEIIEQISVVVGIQ